MTSEKVNPGSEVQNQKVNLGTEVQELAETIDSDDERSSLSLQISELKLEQEKVKLQIAKTQLGIEEGRLDRIQKNSARRPKLFFAMCSVIAIFYVGFFLMVFCGPTVGICDAIRRILCDPSVGICNETLSDSSVRLYVIEIFLLAVIPTILLTLLMKAIFSATEKKEDKTAEIKISDAIPMKVITENITKS